MKHIKDLSIKKLLQLRSEIVLNSDFLADYHNTLGVDENEAYCFFGGYVEYLEDLAEEDGWANLSIFDLVERYDTKDNLRNYQLTIEA